MKGLLIKDLKIILSNKSMFLVILVIMGMVAFTDVAISAFVTSYISILFTTLVVTTISYDDYDRCISFLMTLPVSRKDYVRGKYVFAVVAELCGILLSVVLNVAINMLKKGQVDFNELVFSCAVIFFMMLVFISILLPIQLKFGGEHGRVVLFAVVILSVAGAFGAIQLLEVLNLDLNWFLETVILGNAVMSTVISVVIAAFLLCLSYAISNRIMKKREL